ncbi:MAG TPA: hypothetical protein VFC84_09575 [Desulfosporosinus sp.]|nr:hypothetical protein [Desulfosporosinus sp.]
MPRYLVMSLVVILGLGIGIIVPVGTAWWYNINHPSSVVNTMNVEPALTKDVLPIVTYHFLIEKGELSVIEGTPGTSGPVVWTGLDVQAWSKETLEIAPKVEFYSLDEVQSFIDTASEPS